MRMGAIGALTKPLKSKEALKEVFARIHRYTTPHPRNLLVADADPRQLEDLKMIFGGEGLQITNAATGNEVLAKLKDLHFDAAVIGVDMPDMPGLDLMEEIKKEPQLGDIPVIIRVSRELSKKDEARLKHLGQTMNLKEARSPERLLDAVALFLHANFAGMPEEKRLEIQKLHETGAVLRNKKILVVDDDIRNIFAMTSLLERHEMQIFSAETGKIALDQLQNNPDVDVVLMDIMMPGMDGYDTMRAIRKLAKFRALPVIALTAKAMKGDREKCLDAGASDYIAKPVDGAELLSVLRLWLYR